MTPREFFDSIDYQQLVFQKEDLVASSYEGEEKLIDAVDGIFNLLDVLQDCAAEIFGEEKIFLFEKKAEYILKYRHYCNDNGLYDDSKFLSTREIFEFVESIIIPNEDIFIEGEDYPTGFWIGDTVSTFKGREG